MKVRPAQSQWPLPGGPESGDPLAWVADLESVLPKVEAQVASLMPEAGRFERLRRQADELLLRFPKPAERPPLFGVPVAVKDVFHVEGLPTAAGSRLPPEELGGPQADCVDSLLAAGALILGKAACTEFAYFGAGPTRNPHHLDHTPGGSSSGSAAVVAAGLCPLALGTQTIGSICRPAAFCGVVGYKPTYDRVSRQGLLPLAPSYDHVGPLAQDVAWARRAAEVLCGDWRRDRGSDDWPVLAIPEGAYLERAEPSSRKSLHRLGEHLAGIGYEIQTVDLFPDLEAIEARHRRVVAAEAAQVHAPWFDRFSTLYHPKTRELVEVGRGISDRQLKEDLAGREDLRQRIAEAMTTGGIDLWISPAAPGPAPRGLDFTGDPIMNLPWSHSGLPTLSVPLGHGEGGLPLGLQIAAGWYGDEDLLAWGEPLEAHCHAWT